MNRARRRSYAPLAAAVAALALCACVDDPITAAAGPGVRRAAAPKPWSDDYRRSWGLSVVHAYPAYLAGATGRGVTVAMVDVGVEGAQPGVAATISPLSIDLVGKRDPSRPPSRHGDYVAGALAARLGGGGPIGVAYEASVLSIRAEIDGACRLDYCRMHTADLARGVDYAVDHGVRIIALSLVSPDPLTPRFEAALARAVKAGAVIVAAAGNDGDKAPAWPARYAADPRFAGSVLAVGAVDVRGRMPWWSNRAGAAMQAYLLAPGQNVIADCDAIYCTLVSGTSFAVPYVAGGLALVMQAHPELSAREAAAALLKGARRYGISAANPTWGRGLLDIGEAMRLAKRPEGLRG